MISRNPNLIINSIIGHPPSKEGVDSVKEKNWNWKRISYNEFNRYNSAVIIQRYYRKYGGLSKVEKKDIRAKLGYDTVCP